MRKRICECEGIAIEIIHPEAQRIGREIMRNVSEEEDRSQIRNG